MFRMTLCLFGAMVLATAALAEAVKSEAIAADLTIHEWGTFTTVCHHSGQPLLWQPLLGPLDLPRFVYGPNGKRENIGRYVVQSSKDGKLAFVRMETPVIYFYSDQPRELTVKVDFPKGVFSELQTQGRAAFTCP